MKPIFWPMIRGMLSSPRSVSYTIGSHTLWAVLLRPQRAITALDSPFNPAIPLARLCNLADIFSLLFFGLIESKFQPKAIQGKKYRHRSFNPVARSVGLFLLAIAVISLNAIAFQQSDS
jgi:hypothetical protein